MAYETTFLEIEEWVREMNWKPFEKKIWLSSPTMHGDEQKWVNDAFEKNWITTAGVEGKL